MLIFVIIFTSLDWLIITKTSKKIIPVVTSTINVSKSTSVSSEIAYGSTLVEAKKHTTGVLAKCLVKDAAADALVRKDDTVLSGNNSAFEIQALIGIIDIPAGTNADVNINSYDGTIAKASVIYPAAYGSYNVTITHIPDAVPNQWVLTTTVGCK